MHIIKVTDCEHERERGVSMPVRAKSNGHKKEQRRVQRRYRRFYKLTNLAERLNDVPKYRQQVVDAKTESDRRYYSALADGWGLLEEILTLPTLATRAVRFNREAATHPVKLQGRMRTAHGGDDKKELPPERTDFEDAKASDEDGDEKKVPVPFTTACHPSPRAQALDVFWEAYFHDEGWERFRRCPACQTWFVDDTSNRRKKRCSPKCSGAYWNRGRRRESKRKGQKQGGPSHGTEKRKG